MKKKIFSFLLIVFFLFTGCYTPPPVKSIRYTKHLDRKTLFIGLDGVDYDLVNELYHEGYFQDFFKPIPFLSTFPSDTTLGFTGILQPLNVGKVPGYEVRFYSYEKNKVIGGTPLDIYKIPIKYKYYFDSFRHQMHEKAIMYMFPGMAGKQDLVNTERVVLNSDKKIIMTYLGGTDGSSHIIGRNRTKRFLIYMDQFLKRIQQKYHTQTGKKLQIILFSDHGFHHKRPKTITLTDLRSSLKKHGFRLTNRIQSENDIVTVPFGLLSGGVFFTEVEKRAEKAQAISQIEGMDLVFWHLDQRNKIFIQNSKGEQAYFEYKDLKKYRYIPIKGDPLSYKTVLTAHGHKTNDWLKDKIWKQLTWNHLYPDVGYRLYDAFFNLVENPGSIMFSVKKGYQFGSLMARLGTWAKLGHKGTHGGLFRETTWGVVMTNQKSKKHLPQFLRYDELFHYFLPKIAKKYQQQEGQQKEVSIILTPEQRSHLKEEKDSH